MNSLRILHIVPWFPNPKNKIEAIFIAEHLKELNKHCKNQVLHIQFGQSNFEIDKLNDLSIERVTLKPLMDKWVFKEKKVTHYINKYLKQNQHNFDLVNFYITYPNAINITKLEKKFPLLKFCMMEQWSAYHTQFNLAKGNKGRLRIENIFNNSIPLFTVSNALGGDIQSFIGNTNRKFKVIPNCINVNEFKYLEKTNQKVFVFTSINNWSVMKNPIVLINAFGKLTKKYKDIKLVLAGDGVLMPEMKNLVKSLNISNQVQFLGRIPKHDVVNVLQNANLYCQSSNYETFSAICIEALATGTPVIATNIGGMKDFVNSENGALVDTMTINDWAEAMEQNYLSYNKFDKQQISKNCINQFNSKRVGELFHSELSKVVNEK